MRYVHYAAVAGFALATVGAREAAIPFLPLRPEAEAGPCHRPRRFKANRRAQLKRQRRRRGR